MCLFKFFFLFPFFFSAFVLLVSLAGIVKLTSTTAHRRRCVTTAPVKTVSTTSLVSVTMGSQEGSVMKILTIVKVCY